MGKNDYGQLCQDYSANINWLYNISFPVNLSAVIPGIQKLQVGYS